MGEAAQRDAKVKEFSLTGIKRETAGSTSTGLLVFHEVMQNIRQVLSGVPGPALIAAASGMTTEHTLEHQRHHLAFRELQRASDLGISLESGIPVFELLGAEVLASNNRSLRV